MLEKFQLEFQPLTHPDNKQKFPNGLTEEDGKLYRNVRLLVPEFWVLQLCEVVGGPQQRRKKRNWVH